MCLKPWNKQNNENFQIFKICQLLIKYLLIFFVLKAILLNFIPHYNFT